MSVRVRFAPSPTGHLHIGGARTALYNYLYAKAVGGTFVLRVEDTDLERSKREYEELQLQSLKWLGIQWQEGPDCPGEYGPYRQSERLDIYRKYAEQLVEGGQAYYCFCTDAELEQMKEKAIAAGEDPRYDGRYRDYPIQQARERIAKGEKATIRFKVPQKKYALNDHVRGQVEWPADMVGDFVIIRSNGLPVYNFCCVVDDWLMKITHVIRAEDHLNNTVRQLMVYEALGATPPEFAHVSLLVGKDRQKLSKRHGATAVDNYQDQSYLPEAINNYLCLLGWTHPEEKDIFQMDELLEYFNLDRFHKSHAVYDVEKLTWINGQHLRQKSVFEMVELAAPFLDKAGPYHEQDQAWKERFFQLFNEKIELFSECDQHVQNIFSAEVEATDNLKEIFSWETTPTILNYVEGELKKLDQNGQKFVTSEIVGEWLNHLKKELKIKGKPLFMGTRGVLTGQDHGPDLKELVALTPIKVLLKRLEKNPLV